MQAANQRTILLHYASAPKDDLLRELGTSMQGLDAEAVDLRQVHYGRNEVDTSAQTHWLRRLAANMRNPLVLLLLVLGLLAVTSNNGIGAAIIAIMLATGVLLRTMQETRSDNAAQQLQERILVSATVIRSGTTTCIPIRDLVPGDIVMLAAGDMVPADVRLLTSDDVHIDQRVLTGESVPIEKDALRFDIASATPLDHPALCFQGSTMQAGYATAVVLATGATTFMGGVTAHLAKPKGTTAFDVGIARLTWTMVTAILVLAPVVILINGLLRGNWFEALLFGTAVAVGLTPEMLPMIVSVNLASGALALAKKHVIVKRLSAMQDLGAIDVLCTDKTGTLTQGKVVLMRHVDPYGADAERVLHLGYLNSYFEAGLKNLMDQAVLDHEHLQEALVHAEGWVKLDENPFDFHRRRLSVLLRNPSGACLLVCKGAVEDVLHLCASVADTAQHTAESLQRSGFRVVAVATAMLPSGTAACSVAHEHDMQLEGFLAFLDPPKETAAAALHALAQSHIRVVVLTGDSALATQHVCQAVGMDSQSLVLGTDVAAMTDTELRGCVETTAVFARLEPQQKERVIAALQQNNHVVGFLGDGINDALALRKADVGISVDSAVDVAREASDIVLLEHSLLVVLHGIRHGRRVFGNVMKYIRMATSSSVGNVLSYVGASALLPFIPMLPLQVLLNNVLYDLSQLSIPTDTVDEAWLAKPRRWAVGDVRRFMLLAGPISSVFDYATFGVLVWAFGALQSPAMFHTGWFVASVCTQTLVILVLRTPSQPWHAPYPSPLLLASLVMVILTAITLPFTPVASVLGFTTLPPMYWLWLTAIVTCYLASVWFVMRRRGVSGVGTP